MRNSEAPPFYYIYGERARDLDPRFVHVERVSDRGRFHQGHVRAHSHPHLHQLSFWLHGEGEYVAEGERHRLSGAAVTWMPSGVVHGFDVSGESDSIVVSLSHDFVAETLGTLPAPQVQAVLRRPVVMPVTGPAVERLRDAFLDMEQEYSFPSWAQSAVVGAQVRLVFLTLARLVEASTAHDMATQGDAGTGSLFAAFLTALDTHFQTDRTVEAYASRLGTTPYLLNRATQAGAGMRASHVIRARVLQEAKRLLLYTMLDVAEVGFTLGFADAAHFGRLFRAETGLSPARWRARQKASMAA